MEPLQEPDDWAVLPRFGQRRSRGYLEKVHGLKPVTLLPRAGVLASRGGADERYGAPPRVQTPKPSSTQRP